MRLSFQLDFVVVARACRCGRCVTSGPATEEVSGDGSIIMNRIRILSVRVTV